jgi:hypothetical protein
MHGGLVMTNMIQRLEVNIFAYNSMKDEVIRDLKTLIADMMERGNTLAEIDAYLSSDPFKMIGLTLPQDLVRAALALA